MFERVIPVFSNDDVVHDLNAHRVRDLQKARRRLAVVLRRGDIVGWMIVHEQNRVRVLQKSLLEYFSGMDKRGVQGAFEKLIVRDHLSCRIQINAIRDIMV